MTCPAAGPRKRPLRAARSPFVNHSSPMLSSMCLVPARFLAQNAVCPTGTKAMIQRAAAAALGLLAGSLGSAGLAGAQYYPPSSYPPSSYPPSSRPYYPAPYRLVPPADIDEDDPPLGSLPSDYERPAGRPMPNAGLPPDAYPAYGPRPYRSEERRVGKECRSRWS